MKCIGCLVLCCFIMAAICPAQQIALKDTLTYYSDPGVKGMQKPKGIEIKYERVLDYGIDSQAKGEGITNGNGEVSLNRRVEFKLKFPVLAKSALKVAIGQGYFVEEYRFENIVSNTYPFYSALEDKSLKSIGTSFYLLKSTRKKSFFILRASFNLNGDYQIGNRPTADYLRFSFAPLLGWKKDANVSYGLGFSYSYDFGRPAIYPLLVYNRTFNPHLGIESLLPASVKLRYNINKKTIAFLKWKPMDQTTISGLLTPTGKKTILTT